ncbi:hypothetical protein PHMEG_00032604, partial [Phytophthora megakarya]
KIKKRTQVFCSVFDLAACTCATITTRKSRMWLKYRWASLRTTTSRRERSKPQLIEYVNTDLLDQVQPTSPSCFPICGGSSCISPTFPNRYPDFEIIDDITQQHLLLIATSITPRSKGKWIQGFQEYSTLNPSTKLTPEQLRYQLRPQTKKRKQDLNSQEAQSIEPIPPSVATGITTQAPKLKRPRVTCPGCHAATVRCDPNSKNKNYQYRQQNNPVITSFFTSSVTRTTNLDTQ